jgi:hypothetical protein
MAISLQGDALVQQLFGDSEQPMDGIISAGASEAMGQMPLGEHPSTSSGGATFAPPPGLSMEGAGATASGTKRVRVDPYETEGDDDKYTSMMSRLLPKLPERVVADIKSVHAKFCKALSSLLSCRTAVEKISEDVAKLKMGEVPRGLKQLETRKLAPFYSNTLDEDLVVTAAIPKGTSFSDAKKTLHVLFLRFNKEIDLQARRSQENELEEKTDFDNFMTECIAKDLGRASMVIEGLKLRNAPKALFEARPMLTADRVTQLYVETCHKIAGDQSKKEQQAEEQVEKRKQVVKQMSSMDAGDHLAQVIDKQISKRMGRKKKGNYEVDHMSLYHGGNAEDCVTNVAKNGFAPLPKAQGGAEGSGKGKGPKGKGKGKNPGKGMGKTKTDTKGKGKGAKDTPKGKGPPKGGSKGKEPKGKGKTESKSRVKPGGKGGGKKGN